jgi:hypothetical protein
MAVMASSAIQVVLGQVIRMRIRVDILGAFRYFFIRLMTTETLVTRNWRLLALAMTVRAGQPKSLMTIGSKRLHLLPDCHQGSKKHSRQ